MIDNFKEEYLKLKNKGLSDMRISQLMFIGISTLKRYKEKCHIITAKTPRPNKLGITENQLCEAESNGIERHIVLQRVRYYEWDIEKALTTPKISREQRHRKH